MDGTDPEARAATVAPQRAGTKPADASRDVTDVIARAPLTPVQFGMIYDGLARGRPEAGLEQLVVAMPGEHIDADRLRRCVARAVERHEALRTTIVIEPDGVVQQVHRHGGGTWRVVDHPTGRDAVRRFLAEDRATPVDLSVRPNWRAQLLVDDGGAVFVWTIHHALIDGTSMRTLLAEVFDRYDAETAGHAPPPLAEPAQPREHVALVRAADADGVARAHLDAVFDGWAGPVALPRRERLAWLAPAPRGPTGVEVNVDATTTERLRSWAERSAVTMPTALLTAWAVLLARHTGHDDVVFGVTRAGRAELHRRSLVGCAIATIPVRVDAGPSRTLVALARDLRQQISDMRPFEHASLVETARAHGVTPSALLSSVVSYEAEGLGEAMRDRAGPWRRRVIALVEGDPAGLVLSGHPMDQGLRLILGSDPGVHDPVWIDQVADHLPRVLAAIGRGEPDATVGELELIGPRERATLLARHGTGVGAPDAISTLDRLGVADSPIDRIVVREAGTGRTLSAAALTERVEAVADVLHAAGVRTGTRVALHTGRGLEHVVALAATLRCGAAFVPLEITAPDAAIAHALAASAAAVVVVSGSSPPPAALETAGATVVALADTIAAPRRPPGTAVPPDTAAYVIFTSGSTGVPKGVAVSRAALAAHVAAVTEAYQLEPEDRVLQFASLGFDISIEEIVPTIAAGAELVLRSDEMLGSFGEFLAEVERHEITVLNLPTAFWHELVEHMSTNGRRLPASVRLVVVGGEKPSRPAYDRWRELAPDVRWLNAYGPTETTITATVWDPADADLRAGDDLPIGRPLAHARTYVGDGDGRMVPDGARGELWIGGAAVALGYLDDVATGERFRPDPHGRPGDRMFRTGDQARWLPTGDLAFLGRRDRQVKVRGHRIELDGVSAVLAEHPDVAAAVTDVRAVPGRGDVLVAWAVARSDTAPTSEHLRSHVAARLGAAATPELVAVVDRLPMHSGDKVALRALPTPTMTAALALGADPSAEPIAAVFARVLGVEAVDPDRSFFESGGHSLLALTLIDQLERELGRRVSLAELHRRPSPRALIERDGAADISADEPFVMTLGDRGTAPPLYAVHTVGPNGARFRPLARRLAGRRPVHVVSIPPSALVAALDVGDLSARYAAAIDRHARPGPVAVAGFCAGASYAIDTVHHLRQRGRVVELLALIETEGPLRPRPLPWHRRTRARARALRELGPRYLWWAVMNPVRDDVRALHERWLRATGRHEPPVLVQHRFDQLSAACAQLYRPRPIDVPTMVCYADAFALDPDGVADTDFGWRGTVVGPLRLVAVAGGHLTLLDEPNVGSIAAALDPSPLDP